MSSSSGVVNVDGALLRYKRNGTGTPVVIIGTSLYYPRVFPKDLELRFDVTYTDSRHFVGTYHPTDVEFERLTLDRFAEDVEEVRSALEIPQVVVLGHSVHAQLAIRYAQRHPERTSHLVLLAGIPYAMSEYASVAADFWDRDASDERKQVLAKAQGRLKVVLDATAPTRVFSVMHRADGPRLWADPHFDAHTLLDGLENNAALNRLFPLVPARAIVRAALEQLALPIFIGVGRYDYLIPYMVWEEFVSGLPNVTVHRFEDSAHYPQMEQPEEFISSLGDWLQGQARRGN